MAIERYKTHQALSNSSCTIEQLVDASVPADNTSLVLSLFSGFAKRERMSVFVLITFYNRYCNKQRTHFSKLICRYESNFVSHLLKPP